MVYAVVSHAGGVNPNGNANTPNQNIYQLFRSANGGSTWGSVTLPPEYMGDAGHYANAVLIFTNTNGTQSVFVGGKKGVYRSNDAGVTWVNVTTDAAGNAPAYSVHTFVQSGTTLLAGTDGGLFAFDTVAGTWSSLNSNMANSQVISVGVDPNTPTTLYAGSQAGGISKTTGSEAWNRVDNGGTLQPYGGQVWVNPTNPSIVYAISQQGPISNPGINLNGFVSTSVGGLLIKSVDGGATRTRPRSPASS